MDFQRIRVLRGPNIWSRAKVLEAEIDFGELRSAPPEVLTGFLDRLTQRLPLHSTTRTFAEGLAHAAVRLQILASSPVSFASAHEPRVAVEFEEEHIGVAALHAARDLCRAVLRNEPFDVAATVANLRDLGHSVRLGPSTICIVNAARQRGIPTRRLGEGSLVLLGWGALQRRVLTAETDRTGAIAQYVAQDKHLTRALLQELGLPVPVGRPVNDAADAWHAAQELGLPVVVKPQYGNQGRGVATNLTTKEQVEQAYAAAREESSYILVERFIPGGDFRVLVVGDKVVAASRREPAHVIGDGHSTVAELIAETNKDPRRSDGHSTSLSWIKLDAVARVILAEQGCSPESVPAAGKQILIRRNGNLSTGGTATDVTDQVHPDVGAKAVEAARAVGLDIAGVDVVAVDIGKPMAVQGAAIVEVNAGPGLRMHLDPSEGKPRPVGEAIVDLLFQPNENGRIPLVAVAGGGGKPTTSQLLAQLLRGAGKRVGLACPDGLSVEGRRIDVRDCEGWKGVRSLLLHSAVDAAVLETSPAAILQEGLGFDRCSVAIVTGATTESAGATRVMVGSVAEAGVAVLNAETPIVAEMASACPGSVVYFATSRGNEIVQKHVETGGLAVVVEGSAIVALRPNPVTIACVPAGQVEHVLAAIGAALALGLSAELIRRELGGLS
jgi:cyanophycin synthetase